MAKKVKKESLLNKVNKLFDNIENELCKESIVEKALREMINKKG